MSIEEARNWLDDARFEVWECRRCPGQGHDAEDAALAYDLAIAESIRGRGTPTATRLAAHDAAIREGVAWS